MHSTLAATFAGNKELENFLRGYNEIRSAAFHIACEQAFMRHGDQQRAGGTPATQHFGGHTKTGPSGFSVGNAVSLNSANKVLHFRLHQPPVAKPSKRPMVPTKAESTDDELDRLASFREFDKRVCRLWRKMNDSDS